MNAVATFRKPFFILFCFLCGNQISTVLDDIFVAFLFMTLNFIISQARFSDELPSKWGVTRTPVLYFMQ
jgi:hypothetical protein